MIPESNFTTLFLPTSVIGANVMIGVICTAASCAYVILVKGMEKPDLPKRERSSSRRCVSSEENVVSSVCMPAALGRSQFTNHG